MISCHECGSEVAENIVFCPFCGISLQPVAVAGAEPDESLESTIMMPPSEIAKLVENDPGVKKSEDSATKAVELESDDVPMPGILRGVSKTSGNVDVRSTSGLKSTSAEKEELVMAASADAGIAEPAAGLVEEGEPTEGAEEISWDDAEFGEAAAEEKAVAAAAEVGSEASIEEPGEPNAAVAPPTAEPKNEVELEATGVEVIEPIAAEVDIAAVATESPLAGEDSGAEILSEAEAEGSKEQPVMEAEEAPLAAAETAEPETKNDRVDLTEGELPKADSEIAKPNEELESSDDFSSKPMFDSVRIMENSDQFSQDFIATRLGSPESGTAEAESFTGSAAAANSAGPQPEAQSSTTPGIGTIDTDGRSSKKLKPLVEGTVLNGRYEIIRKIGGGGMGAVYLASDNNLGGVLRAVKEMVQTHIEEAQQDKAVNDFKRESMILSTLDHVSVPTIFDYFYDEAESRFYLVMKYVSGGDLASRLRAAPEGKLDEVTVTEWAIQIIDVLDYLHNQPSTIVYRDLKPSNIMIDGNSGRVMLIDFGIARSIGQQQEKGVTAVGTMGYAPPELFSGNVEPRSDIYSLGSTMFHLLTGADPQSNPLLIFDFQKNPRPRQINPRISDQMEQILMRAVEYSADARFASAAVMRSILVEHLAMLKDGRATFGVAQAPTALGLANQAAFCGFCGQQIIASDLFCAFCGSRQPIAQPGVAAAARPVAAATAKLFIEGTSELSTPVYQLQKDQNLVGRRDPMSNIFPEIDLSKYDPQTKISRRHARIWREGATYLVEDLGSSNGTMLATAMDDGVKLSPHKPQVLSHGDKLKIGDTTLHFVVG